MLWMEPIINMLDIDISVIVPGDDLLRELSFVCD